MRKSILFCLLSAICALLAHAQVSHGGKPLPFTAQTKSVIDRLFENMPPFDLEEELRIDAIEANDLRGGYRFAYKFMTDFNSSNSGRTFTLSDGSLVWQLGIQSAGAQSINLLFSEYELPEGAQLFIYNPNQTQVLGSFNHLNNSKLGILPTSPLLGDELIIEYQEPANASFRGRLTLGEVNHAYRSLRAYEPKGDRADFWCMPSPVCIDSIAGLDSISRSVVLITLDGVRACTGVLVNNTSKDGKPYMMTASHCLNNNFAISNPDYDAIAGRIVTYFNYNSPACDTVMRGTEEMSVASANYVAVYEKNDMALLELMETPPPYFRPFYAGWSIEENAGLSPYSVIHHPVASVKRVNIISNSNNITLKTFMPEKFSANSHWNVSRYSVGCTDAGSSGAPLFNSSNQITGLLSGGRSTCNYPSDDFYYALFKAWNVSNSQKEQLKCWLDPIGSNIKTIDGLDPYAANSCYRLSHIFESRLNDSIEITSIPGIGNMFGINTLQTAEYAEEYHAGSVATVEGVYLVTPVITDPAGSLNVEVLIYSSAAGKPQQLLHKETFSPTYLELASMEGRFIETLKPLNRMQETFVRFHKEVKVSGTFFVAYRITSSANSSFAVYNLRKGQTVQNTAWINYQNSWIPATQHPALSFNTSLFLDPVIRYTGHDSNENIPKESQAGISVDSGSKTLHIIMYESNTGIAQVDVYTVSGQRLLNRNIEGNSGQIPLTSLSSGVYIVNLHWGAHSHTQKIVL